jgi:glycosyltransferase involved in cell wall biosynthesis
MLNNFKMYVSVTNSKMLVFKIDPDNKEAPFQFNMSEHRIEFENENEYNKNEIVKLINGFKPDVIICSGWSNKKYLYVVRQFYKYIPCVLTMDNQWHGSLKQYIGCMYAKVYLKKLFFKIWVPGNAQVNFAKKLGFLQKDILTGWYVANHLFLRKIEETTFNKRFVFVGRYVIYKGIKDLVESFISLKNSQNNPWQLHCYGTGELLGKLPDHKDIYHHGFVQPSTLFEEAKKGGVFVLPSHFEPWGLVVQEFALAGYPLLVSNKVGASQQVVKPDNGLIFEAKNQNSLTKALQSFVNKSDIELLSMSKKSQDYGQQINTNQWIQNLNKIVY